MGLKLFIYILILINYGLASPALAKNRRKFPPPNTPSTNRPQAQANSDPSSSGTQYQATFAKEFSNSPEVEKFNSKITLSGIPLAEYFIGDFYRFITAMNREPEKAIQLFQISANMGDSGGQYNLGIVTLFGLGVPQNIQEARRLFEKSAAQGNPSAQHNLGLMYQFGIACETDFKKSVQLYKIAAAKGNSYAQNSLGVAYELGRGVPKKNAKRAFRLFSASAAQGNPWGEVSLGVMYSSGDGGAVPRDLKKALQLLISAANKGLSWAQVNLAHIYSDNRGIPSDYKKALEYLLLAVKQGNEQAQLDLGKIYRSGTLGEPVNQVKALSFFRQAANQGLQEAEDLSANYLSHEEPGLDVVLPDSERMNSKNREHFLKICAQSMRELRNNTKEAEGLECPVCLERKHHFLIPTCALERSQAARGAQVPAHPICSSCFDQIEDQCPLCRKTNVKTDAAEVEVGKKNIDEQQGRPLTLQ